MRGQVGNQEEIVGEEIIVKDPLPMEEGGKGTAGVASAPLMEGGKETVVQEIDTGLLTEEGEEGVAIARAHPPVVDLRPVDDLATSLCLRQRLPVCFP